MQREPLTVYFHGHPGAASELALVPGDLRHGWPEILLASAHTGREPLHAARMSALAAALRWQAGARPLRLIGFSLGAFEAMQVASHMHGQVSRLDLISAAAPLETGDFLPHMAGQRLFRAALRGRTVQALRAQSLALRLAPGLVRRAMFKGVTGAEAAFAADATFQRSLDALLRAAFGPGFQGFAQAVSAYVKPWAELLPQITAETHLWHGLEDRWAPYSMAEALAERIAGPTLIRPVPEAGHYSTLITALPLLMAE